MVFVVASIVVEGQSKLIKPWYGITIDQDIRVADLYAEFCDGKYDNESLPDSDRRSFVKVLAGKFALYIGIGPISAFHLMYCFVHMSFLMIYSERYIL
jgi:hypothetical protein